MLFDSLRDREKPEQAARDWQATFDSITDLVALLDTERRIVQCNRAMRDFLGMSDEEIRGRTCCDLVHGEGKWPRACPFSMASETRQKEAILLPVGDRVMEVVVHPIVNDDGQMTGAVHILRDVTGQKRMEEELRNQRALSDAIIESSPGVFCVCRGDGSMIRWNENGLKITGYTAAEMAEKNVFDFFGGKDCEEVAQGMRNVLSEGFTEIEAELISKDGARTPYHFTGVPAMIGGEPCVVSVGIDLSARKKAEDDLDRLFNASMDMLFIARSDGFLDRLNPAWTKALGWTEQELTTRGWMEFVHPDDREITTQAGAQLGAGEVLTGFENRYRCKDGSYRWLSWNVIPIPDRGELVGVARDVTGPRWAQERLRKSEQSLKETTERLNLATSAGGVGVWDWDVKSDALIWDDSMCSLYGIEREAFGGDFESWRTMLHHEDQEKFDAAIRTAKRDETEYKVEFRIVRPDGTVRHLRGAGAVHRDGDGGPVRMLGVNWDATERILLEENLRSREKWAKGLQEAGEMLAGCHTVEGLARVAARAPSEYLGLKYSWIGVAEPDGTAQPTVKCVPEARGVVRESKCMRCVLKSPETIMVPDTLNAPPFGDSCADWARQHGFASCATYPIRAGEKCVAALTVQDQRTGEDSPLEQTRPLLEVFCRQVGDVWERCLREEQLRTARTAALAGSRAKSEFLANMSHEIRTPLNAVIGLTHLALQTDLNSIQRNYLNKVNSSSDALLGVINDILDFSKIEAGKIELEAVEFEFQKITTQLLDVFGAKAEEKGLRLFFDFPPDLPGAAVGDPLRFQQVLNNLVSNALKFTNEGQISVAARLAERNAGRVVLEFSVRDTGIGMSEGQLARVFDAFSQADSSTTRQFGGTGLGLSICQRLVSLMGGEIRVESQVGQGSTFTFTAVFQLPRAEAEPAAPVPAGLRDLRALVVDDNEGMRRLLVRQLESLSLRAEEAPSARDALAVLDGAPANDPFRLVLMDWEMPGLSGTQAAALIRDRGTLPVAPRIILTSGYWGAELSGAVDDKQIDQFLSKPVSSSSLLDAVLQVFPEEAGEFLRASRLPSAEDWIPDLSGRRILLVEDNELNQEVALAMLKKTGCEVTVAENGREAVRAAAGHEFDAILMDIQMPELDGYEAARLIRAREAENRRERFGVLEAGTRVPIIATTASATTEDRRRVLASGMDDHIGKPMAESILLSTLARLLGVKPAASGDSPAPAVSWMPDRSPREQLPPIDGIDATAGLRFAGNDAALFRRLLRGFAAEQGTAIEKIETALRAGRARDAERVAHTLKGLAGSIGARAVRERARAVEGAIGADAPGALPRLLSDLRESLAPVVTAIQAALPEERGSLPDGPPRRVEKEALLPLLEKLEDLLSNDDTRAAASTDRIGELVRGTLLAPSFQPLESAARNYDFSAAHGALRTFQQKLLELPS